MLEFLIPFAGNIAHFNDPLDPLHVGLVQSLADRIVHISVLSSVLLGLATWLTR